MKKPLFKTAFIAIPIFLIFQIGSAQMFPLQPLPSDKPQFGIRYLRPNFEPDIDMSTFSGIYDLSVNIPVNPNLNIVGSLPFVNVAFDDMEGESSIGNIYLGLQTRQKNQSEKISSMAFGLFLPTISDKKWDVVFLGIFTNAYEMQKYTPNNLIIYGNFTHHYTQSRGALFGFEIGSDLWIPTENGDDVELMVHYGLSGGYQITNLAISTELLGRFIITEDVDDFADRFTHSIAFGGQWTEGTVRPGIFYQIHLDDDLDEVVDGVLGIQLNVSLK